MLIVVASSNFFEQVKIIHDNFKKDFPNSKFAVWIGFDDDKNIPFIGILDELESINFPPIIGIIGIDIFISKQHFQKFSGIILIDYKNGYFLYEIISNIYPGQIVIHSEY